MNQSIRRVLVTCVALGILLPSSSLFGASGSIGELAGVDQRRAEEIFATAEAAVYFPALKQVRWVAAQEGEEALKDFDEAVEQDFPRFRSNAHGPYLLKRPLSTGQVAIAASALRPEPLATVFTDSFENGMSNWTLDNNTLDLYSWGTTGCEARSGARSADALRGGVNTLGCADVYAPSVTTTMIHNSCEGIGGASQAWLDAYVHIATETGADTLGFYYPDATGRGYGYGFSGTWNAWFHIGLNLKQWYRLGDVTTVSCPKLAIQFSSDADTQSGFGARIDDITIGNAAPEFLSATIAASPATGAVPLTVNFSPSTNGASSAAAYQWSFGDAAASTATTRTASFTYATPGDYSVRLRVEEGTARAYAHTTIRATAGAICSVTCTASVPATATSGTPALFQATTAATGCSGAPSYLWTFGDGQTSSQQNASHTYAAAGTYSWTLATSVGGTSCTKSGPITVGGGQSARRRSVGSGGAGALAKGVIGTGGGTLSGGGLTLTVPAGAFPASASLVLRKAGTARQEGDLTDTYSISGMPGKFLSGVTFETEIGSPSLAANEKYYITLSALTVLKSRPEATAVMDIPVEATLSGSKLRVTVPSTWPMPSGAISKPEIESSSIEPDVYTGEFKVKAERLTPYQTAHFVAREYPSKSAQATAVINMLESHYDRLAALGFSFACRNDSAGQFRRIVVDLADLGTGSNDPLGYHVSPFTGSDPCGTNSIFASDYLQITTSYAAADSKVRGAAAHELFHLVQDMYTPGSPAANLWLKEASSTWIENALGLCPDIQNANDTFPWRGLFNSQNSESDTEARHGYGASYAIKYRIDSSSVQNDPFLSTLWSNIRLGNSEVAAFEAALGSSLPVYWKDFSKKYFFGTATGTCFPTWASFPRATIADDKAVPQSTTFAAYPLSARSWNLDLQKFKSDTPLAVSLSASGLIGEQSVVIWDVKAKSELAELTKEKPSYDIADLNSKQGTVLVALLVDRNLPGGNPNAQSATNDVTLKLGENLQKGWCSIRVKEVEGCGSATAGRLPDAVSFVAKWNGNSFEATGSEVDPIHETVNYRGDWTIRGTVSADRKTLSSFTYEQHGKTTWSNSQLRECPPPSVCFNEAWNTVTLGNVPADANSSGSLLSFSARGATARPMITKWSHRVLTSGWTGSTLNFDCTYAIDESRLDAVKILVMVY